MVLSTFVVFWVLIFFFYIIFTVFCYSWGSFLSMGNYLPCLQGAFSTDRLGHMINIFGHMILCVKCLCTLFPLQVQRLQTRSIVCVQLHSALLCRECHFCSLGSQPCEWYLPVSCSGAQVPWRNRQQGKKIVRWEQKSERGSGKAKERWSERIYSVRTYLRNFAAPITWLSGDLLPVDAVTELRGRGRSHPRPTARVQLEYFWVWLHTDGSSRCLWLWTSHSHLVRVKELKTLFAR